jgi:hypothetical protein
MSVTLIFLLFDWIKKLIFIKNFPNEFELLGT